MLEVIRRSRFVVADITYDNSGAYWEAGFAEGLDKKVIYTVSKVWIDEDRKNRVHFDTDHFNRIEWDVDNLEEAGGKLTAMIRNTFLAEVKMVDG
jgi:nucleoside 2-deoxyribosyltransferase